MRLEHDPQLDLVALLDVDEADAWGANCGPAALAGAFGLQLADVREAVSDAGVFRGYMTITHMRAAIDRLGGRIDRTWSKPATLRDTDGSPIICCVQWHGPWMTVPRAAATKRHFIAYRAGYVGERGPGWVCDVNVPRGWILASAWHEVIVPLLIPKRGDGKWSIQWAAQVSRNRSRPTAVAPA
jgi:hypothetical protein